ncbi:unnamed protein product [Orchesella dallaii]|uniref:BZIP domain-containing protein n=1 Tax=Orchesella dallaii TaxID=48710 RepID=A0ABP1PWX7_9HEXA
MLPPVKFNMLGQMQLRGGGGSSGATTTSVSSCSSSPESKSPSSKTSPPCTSSSSSASSLSPRDSSTLLLHTSNASMSGYNVGNGMMSMNANITLPFGSSSDPHHQINSAFAWQFASSSQLIEPLETRKSHQNGCRGAGDGVAVGAHNSNTDNNSYNQHQRNSCNARDTISSSHRIHQHQQQQHGKNNSVTSRNSHHQHRESKESKETDGITNGVDSDTSGRADSPLDFSTKKKFKPEPLVIKGGNRERSLSTASDKGDSARETSDSPCSRLRNILSMKSPTIPEDMAGTVLNLSKESPSSTIWCKSESPSNSNSCSPMHENSTFVQSNSPRPAAIPMTMVPSMGVPSAGVLSGSGTSSNGTSSMGLPSWGSGAYSPSLSPILNQTVPGNGGIPLSFETSPTLFPHHVATGAASPAMPFAPSLSLPLPSNGSSAGSKRATRPFKAYPKDPLSFPTVGLYGIPMGSVPGTTEAVIHQQSNQAYAEFRKQMLSSSQFGKSRRGGQRNNSPFPIGADSIDGHLSDSGSMTRANDSGSASDDGLSLTNGKSRLGKSEQQMKDEAYWERRRKNNEAAKRSRDARRAKEDEIAIRAAFLEQENLKLRFEVCALKSETAKLRCMLYSS